MLNNTLNKILNKIFNNILNIINNTIRNKSKYIFILPPIITLIIIIINKYNNILTYINRVTINMIKNKSNKPYKVVVFDLDETLGNFIEISIFWDALEKFYGHKLFNNKFYEVLDTFPEFFRPNIFKILNLINNKKKRKLCDKSYIYTNNQGPKSWVYMINDYFDKKLGYKVFDGVIAAYKAQGKIVEPKRTSHDKSVKDLINCTNIPADSEVIFIDDVFHPLMNKENVKYINIKPYVYSLPYNVMAERYYNKVLMNNTHKLIKNKNISREKFTDFIVSFMNMYNYNINQKPISKQLEDIEIGKSLYSSLDDFLKLNKLSNTRKKRTKHNKTHRHK